MTDPQVSEAHRIRRAAYQRLSSPSPLAAAKPTTAEPIEIFPTM